MVNKKIDEFIRDVTQSIPKSKSEVRRRLEELLNEKKVEMNQRNKHEVLLPCRCGGNHFALFDYYDWDDHKEFYIAMIDRSYSFLDRIKNAIKHIIKGGDLYSMDILVNEEDLDKVIDLINEYKKI